LITTFSEEALNGVDVDGGRFPGNAKGAFGQRCGGRVAGVAGIDQTVGKGRAREAEIPPGQIKFTGRGGVAGALSSGNFDEFVKGYYHHGDHREHMENIF
jgi:hypothetical protein